MLLPKITKRIRSREEVYAMYIGVLQAVSNLKITQQEKQILSIILKHGELTKDVRKELCSVTSKARVENILSKLRARKFLIGDKPNDKFPNIALEETSITITFKPNDQEQK